MAIYRVTALESLLKQHPAEDYIWPGIQKSTLLTFETIFGTVYGGPDEPEKEHEENMFAVELVKGWVQQSGVLSLLGAEENYVLGRIHD